MTQPVQVLKIDSRPSEGAKTLLLENIIGTPGKSMVYRHEKTAEKLEHIPEPFFVSLVRRERVLATCCFCKREFGGRSFFYVRYFTFHQNLRMKGDKALMTGPKESAVRKEIHGLLTGKYFGSLTNNVFYAYLDPDNARSRRLTEEFGFRKMAVFASLVFSRWRPVISNEVEKLGNRAWSQFKNTLAQHYRFHLFFTFENLYYRENYFVIRESQRIVAGLQANPECWKVYAMPGLGGKILMKVFPRVGFLKKMFDPNYQFVSVEGIYFEKGYEQLLEKLLEHVLAYFGVHSAVLCADVKSTEYLAIKQMNLGLVSRLRKEKRMEIVVKENGGKPLPLDQPAYVSCFDLT